jgi:hypothetical protein
MAQTKKRRPNDSSTPTRPSEWTREEQEREERVHEIRARKSREQTPEVRLEETVRLSRFISELRQGLPDDVRTR